MSSALHHRTVLKEWSEEGWTAFSQMTSRTALQSSDPHVARRVIARAARGVLRNYSTSFFVVTRFLPAAKRAQVDVVYAAVRYPDEIVDTFPFTASERLHQLSRCRSDYESGLRCAALEQGLRSGLNPFIAAFAEVVKLRHIPHELYRSFLEAMELDVAPRPFSSLEDLIESYVYGSAIVVGYFLAYVYGSSGEGQFDRVMAGSRDLGIALQLTNFLRDVREDYRRGRVYLPQDLLAAHGIQTLRFDDAEDVVKINNAVRELSRTAEEHYARAERSLDAFAPDCRVAIASCIHVYRCLNQRIGRSPKGILHRETVPALEKFAVLPASKYWRLPLAYAGVL